MNVTLGHPSDPSYVSYTLLNILMKNARIMQKKNRAQDIATISTLKQNGHSLGEIKMADDQYVPLLYAE